jgi:hypothetical protein
MNSDLMSGFMYLFYKMRLLLREFSNQEKCGMDVVFGQHIQHLRRVVRMRAIVKGQREFAA